ncbi:3-deoxy-manno-octulosonate cytidylyltransferase [Flagellimonas baculiformis]|uniref:3-deoxy-manno-octulosonate cytidylyltransferase n=1 Tax=Flagellimonas baculiformis TaxID=3067310 RepID=UPI00296E4853|nr:3-deoxy-manno-octulosonate cytidylyltransferase [Muricauda sp. D6]
MKIVGVIPARYKSSRFPGKPLVEIAGIPLVIRVAQIVEKALGRENTYVATDDERIRKLVDSYGYNAIMTSENCLTGTDRVYDFAGQVKADIYINVQGDEPMIDFKDILKIAEVKKNNFNYVVNGMAFIEPNEDPQNINIPKVVVNCHDQLIYMSRLAIPGQKTNSSKPKYRKQVCIYGFSFKDLESYGKMTEKAIYENHEDIEILRFFDLGIPIKMVETSGSTLAVDVPDDVLKVEKEILKNRNQ